MVLKPLEAFFKTTRPFFGKPLMQSGFQTTHMLYYSTVYYILEFRTQKDHKNNITSPNLGFLLFCGKRVKKGEEDVDSAAKVVVIFFPFGQSLSHIVPNHV